MVLLMLAMCTRVFLRQQSDRDPTRCLRRLPYLRAPELQEAEEVMNPAAWRSGGICRPLELLDGPQHYVLDSRARDLATGADRSDLIRNIHGRWDEPIAVTIGRIIQTVLLISYGRYALIIRAPLRFEPWTFLPYYSIDSPLRRFVVLAARVEYRISPAFAGPNGGPLRPGRSLDPGSIRPAR